MKLLDVLDTDPIQVSMKDHAMESFEIDEKTGKKRNTKFQQEIEKLKKN